MSELSLLILRLGFLALLWGFVFAIIYALRSDLFGQRVGARKVETPAGPFPSSPLSAAPSAAQPAALVTPAPAPRSAPAAPTPAVAPVAPSLPQSSPGDFTEIISPAKPSTPTPNKTVPARRLVITSGPKEGLEIELPGDQLTIGRSTESGLVIRDDYTSTHHARLMLWNEAWMVQDLDSTNGTFLDGTRVTVPTPVPLNTPITIGTTSFELRR